MHLTRRAAADDKARMERTRRAPAPADSCYGWPGVQTGSLASLHVRLIGPRRHTHLLTHTLICKSARILARRAVRHRARGTRASHARAKRRSGPGRRRRMCMPSRGALERMHACMHHGGPAGLHRWWRRSAWHLGCTSFATASGPGGQRRRRRNEAAALPGSAGVALCCVLRGCGRLRRGCRLCNGAMCLH